MSRDRRPRGRAAPRAQRPPARPAGCGPRAWRVRQPEGRARGRRRHRRRRSRSRSKATSGYYCAGMNKQATVRVTATWAWARREHDVRLGDRGGQREPVGRRTGQGGFVVIGGDASARCGISMKGVNRRERSVGHMSAFMAQKVCLVVCGDAGEALGDSIYEAHLYVRGKVAGLGADCSRRKCATSTSPSCPSCSSVPRIEDVDAGDFRRYGSARKLYNFHVDHAGAYDELRRRAAARAARVRDLSTATSSTRSSAPRARGSTTSAASAPSAGAGLRRSAVPRREVSRYPLEGYRERCDTDVVPAPPREEADPPDIPITIAGMSFGALCAPAKEALGRAHRDGHLHHDRRRRHDARGARPLEDARLPAAALPLRDQPRRPAPRRRDRGRRRPGRQARRRRDAHRPEDLRPRRQRCATFRRGSTSAAPAGTRT